MRQGAVNRSAGGRRVCRPGLAGMPRMRAASPSSMSSGRMARSGEGGVRRSDQLDAALALFCHGLVSRRRASSAFGRWWPRQFAQSARISTETAQAIPLGRRSVEPTHLVLGGDASSHRYGFPAAALGALPDAGTSPCRSC
jgi:hypothetical protein